MKRTLIAAALLALVMTGAQAEQSVLYGADGRVVGRSTTDARGAVTYGCGRLGLPCCCCTLYGADGRIVGREATGGNGTTVVYGADGRVVGKATGNAARGRQVPRAR